MSPAAAGNGRASGELLRASATDADAVALYLPSIETEELTTLLDDFGRHERKKKSEQHENWLPLVHLLLRCTTTRLRTASRIIQLLWNGWTSELEAMQWLTEISLGYAGAIEEEDGTQSSRTEVRLRLNKVMEELNVLLELTFEFLHEILADRHKHKSLPPLLSLVPHFLGMLADLKVSTAGDNNTVHILDENLVKLLELPWNANTIPFLLELLKESSSIVSLAGWKNLQESMERMIASTEDLPSDNINPIIRECILIANVTSNMDWINIARYLFRQLPVSLRQEAEFNLQMVTRVIISGCFHQCQRVVTLVCGSMRHSLAMERSATDERTASDDSALRVDLDWHDLIFVFHALHASKPILHPRASSSRVATEASIFTEIEKIAWAILQRDMKLGTSLSTSSSTVSVRAIECDLMKCISDRTAKVLNYSGKQVHARVWKAQLLMDFAFYWMEDERISKKQCRHPMASGAFVVTRKLVGQLLVQAVFQTTPEVRSEILSNMFEGSRSPTRRKEEIVLALKNSILLCQDVRIWCFSRLEHVFTCDKNGTTLSLRRSSWEELSRFLARQVAQFVQPISRKRSIAGSNASSDDNTWTRAENEDEEEEDEFDADPNRLRVRYHIRSFDDFYRQNSSPDGAAAIGLAFQKTLSCFLAFERTAAKAVNIGDGESKFQLTSLGDGDLRRWLVQFVTNWEYFFHWIAESNEKRQTEQQSSLIPIKEFDKNGVWKLLARVCVGSALCSVAIDIVLGASDRDLFQISLGDKELSIWSLMEVQFSLHRMLRRLATEHASNNARMNLSKEYATALFYSLCSVLEPKTTQLISTVNSILVGANSAAENGYLEGIDNGSGLSFAAVQFIVDTCSSAIADDEKSSMFYSAEDNMSSGETNGNEVLRSLLALYFNLRDRIIKMSASISDNSLKRNGDSGGVIPSGGVLFTVYADSIAAKCPKSLRHLLLTNKSARAVVLLDMKAAEDLLCRVCAAVGRTVDAMVSVKGLVEVEDLLRRVIDDISWSKSIQLTSDENIPNGFLFMAHRFFIDMKRLMYIDKLTKVKMASMSLIKRLCEHGPDVKYDTRSYLSSQYLVISTIAYEILCEHVVYHVPLLRILLNVCFPLHLANGLDTYTALEKKIEGVLRACGFRIHRRHLVDEPTHHTSDLLSTPVKRRKRLRQSLEAISSAREYEDDILDITEQFPQPHLGSAETQNVSIHAIVLLLDQSQSTMLKLLSSDLTRHADRIQDLLSFAQLNEMGSRAILNSPHLSWTTPKALVKMLSAVEGSLRVGKACSAWKLRRVDNTDSWNSVMMEIFEGTVHTALTSRTWVNAVKDASQDVGTKTRISSTSLKIDIFLLDVPAIVETMLREMTLTDSRKHRLNGVVSLVKQQLHEMSDVNTRKPTKLHLVGVVPIVRKRRKRLRSRHPYIDECLRDEDGDDAYADLEEFIE